MATVLAESQSPFRLHIKQRPSRVWVGWFRRPGRRWQQVVTAGTERAAWKALTAYQPDRPALESESVRPARQRDAAAGHKPRRVGGGAGFAPGRPRSPDF